MPLIPEFFKGQLCVYLCICVCIQFECLFDILFESRILFEYLQIGKISVYHYHSGHPQNGSVVGYRAMVIQPYTFR